MRKVFTLILLLAVVSVCTIIQTANAAVPDEEQRHCVLESGTHSQQHHAILFKSENIRVSTPARAQTARGAEIQDNLTRSEFLSGVKSVKPFYTSRQTITQQNIVERK